MAIIEFVPLKELLRPAPGEELKDFRKSLTRAGMDLVKRLYGSWANYKLELETQYQRDGPKKELYKAPVFGKKTFDSTITETTQLAHPHNVAELLGLADDFLGLEDTVQIKKDYIKRRTRSAIQKGLIFSPQQVYSFVTDLADRLEIHWNEQFAKRLDAPTKRTKNDRRPYFPVVAVTCETPYDVLVKKQFDVLAQEDKTLSFRETLKTLGLNISSTEGRTLEFILGEGILESNSGLTEMQVRQNSENILIGLENTTAYLFKQRILIPLIAVGLHYGFIQYTPRRKLPNYTVQAILDSHAEGLSAYEVGKRYDVSTPTVIYRWRQAGLEPHYKRHEIRISDEAIAKIAEGHAQGWGSVRSARFANVSQITVLNYWHKHGLPVREQYITSRKGVRRKTSNLSPEQITEILAAHPIYGGNVSRATKKLPFSHLSIRKYWVKAGLPLNKRGQAGLPTALAPTI